MILLWWECEIPPAGRERFSQAQARRQEVAAARGFLGRFGGWSDAGVAWVFELWRDDLDAARFARGARQHIEAAHGSRDAPAGDPVQVEVLVAMPGAAPTTARAVREGRVVRLVRGHASPERHADLMDHQLRIWRPAMARAQGMLGGYFGSCSREPDLFVGASLWRDRAGHDHWVEEIAPRTREMLDAEGLMLDLDGERILLEESWAVTRVRELNGGRSR